MAPHSSNSSTQKATLTAAPTSYFGTLTKAAVMKFQSANGIAPLGSVGPQTRAALNALPTNPSTNSGQAKAALIASLLAKVRALQAQIAALLATQNATSTPVSGGGGGGAIAGTPTTITNCRSFSTARFHRR